MRTLLIVRRSSIFVSTRTLLAGAKILHLPPPALSTLAETPRVEGNPFVIVGGKPGARLINLEKPWRAIRARDGLEDVHLHDLRHAFASNAASSGMGLPLYRQDFRTHPARNNSSICPSCSGPGESCGCVRGGKDRKRHDRPGREQHFGCEASLSVAPRRRANRRCPGQPVEITTNSSVAQWGTDFSRRLPFGYL